MRAIVVHGGAGRWPESRHAAALEGLQAAAEAGWGVLESGGTALDAAIAAAVVLEDDPLFNAGTGSKLNLDGEVEMDAAVMEGHTGRTGAVANLKRVKNPVLVARKVMDETDHILLGGEGALRFARAMGFEDHDPATAQRRAQRDKHLASMREGGTREGLRRLLEAHPELARGTIGAVAIDAEGNLAAATSTGGLTLKMAGRIGDTPVPGAGNHASSFAAASATGRGELIMLGLTTRVVCEGAEAGLDAQAACEAALEHMARGAGAQSGVIAIDREGRIGVAHATANMPHAWIRAGATGGREEGVAVRVGSSLRS